ncbi:energy transducer TonB [Gracilimonas mengyeensis]|uniref:Protein TonB, links inner and outer membranes n=1 Tax=Gracilimonas mengyeensis TaxID=1302730 RepID=A0A521AT74_9BACT|nr:energy transducer TonB [Gracilimonas mengyeensis]SMO38023.1 protein TonB, links inner and outer membranes [Gracilimonas mengyeensis]
MSRSFWTFYDQDLRHEHRFMLALICAELMVIGVIAFWPAQAPEAPPEFDTFSNEEILIDEAIITRQSSAPASPPKPVVPVPVPNDEIIEEEIDFPDMDEIFTNIDAQGEIGTSSVDGEGEIVGSPDRPAGLVRIVEPTVPEAAKRANVKARIEVTFLVGEDGKVEDLSISSIEVMNENGSFERVNQIGYGLMEATLTAASKWRFSPARHNGEPVKTYVRNSFNIGL